MTTPKARLLKVIVQPVFIIDDEDGDVHEVTGEAYPVPGKNWRGFGTEAFGPTDLEAVAVQWHADRQPLAELEDEVRP